MPTNLSTYIKVQLEFLVDVIINKKIKFNIINKPDSAPPMRQTVSYIAYDDIYRFHKLQIFSQLIESFWKEIPGVIEECIKDIHNIKIESFEFDSHSGYFTLKLKKATVCEFCYRVMVRTDHHVTWIDDSDVCHFAHPECYQAAHFRCPQCSSEVGIKIPRASPIYCEECGWPDDYRV